MKITHNYYAIVDLEATCADDRSIPRHRMEIIEIGAVMLNAKSLEIESEFQIFVQPQLHPQLTPFCQSLTSISQTDVDNAPLLPEAIRLFQQWLHSFDSYLFCSWGDYDRHQFRQDCRLHQVEYPFPEEHLNLKKAFSAAMDSRKKYGMRKALNLLNLELDGVHHRGIDDARNIARIVCAVLSSERT